MRRTAIAFFLVTQTSLAIAGETTLGKASEIVDEIDRPVKADNSDGNGKGAGNSARKAAGTVDGAGKPRTFSDLADLARTLSDGPDVSIEEPVIRLRKSATDFNALFGDGEAEGSSEKPGAGAGADAQGDPPEAVDDGNVGNTEHCPSLPI